ncbi:hypothetical protein BLNAU_7000 [Blattamonas nauphoetae]|uniref:Auto-transporter adhesin head GIN domain-containing protein n=1 Tax=Blattamonas nauphoetae TaxID=2049346 RepID=A0ABQ9Y2Z9_9EUKA|nr:hypothetical protein BLNAU_7000 [Blattamonas nauphoetae]
MLKSAHHLITRQSANHTLDNLVITVNGLDSPLCSNNPKCHTLTYMSSNSNKDAKIAVEEGTFDVSQTEEGFDVTSRKLVITGSGMTNTIIKLSKPANRRTSFSVTSGQLAMILIAFSLKGGEAGLQLTIFNLNGKGSLTLAGCNFTHSVNVIKSRFTVIQRGTLKVTKCDFSSLPSTCTHNLVINVSLQGNLQILIDTCVFTSITLQNPDDLFQSAVLLNIEGDMTNYQLQALTFTGGAACKGSDLHFACPDVVPVHIRSHCRFSFKDNKKGNRRFHVKTETNRGSKQFRSSMPLEMTIAMAKRQKLNANQSVATILPIRAPQQADIIALCRQQLYGKNPSADRKTVATPDRTGIAHQ